MNERDIIELHKKDIETFLKTLKIYKSETMAYIDESIKEENIKFIKKEMTRIYAGNVNERLLDQAINELYPHLKES